MQQLRAQAMYFTYPVAETHSMLVTEAGRVADRDPLMAALMLCTASNVSIMAGDVERSEQMALEAVRMVGGDDGPRRSWPRSRSEACRPCGATSRTGCG